MYWIFRAPEFIEWYERLDERAKARIESRLLRIQAYAHFGDYKLVGSGSLKIWELRWKNGTRLYYSYVEGNKVLLLLGGNKHGQQKDIQKAKRIAKKHTEEDA